MYYNDDTAHVDINIAVIITTNGNDLFIQ